MLECSCAYGTATGRFQPGGWVRTMPWRSPTGRRQDSWKRIDTGNGNMRIGVATDHGGFGLKEGLVA